MSNRDENVLPAIARAAISRALGLSAVAVQDATWLQALGACFVTLTQHGQLRGCIGSLQAQRALLDDVLGNAVAAALHDSRFAPLMAAELEYTEIEVSLLSEPQPMLFSSEADALEQLRPGVDGVVLEFGHCRSTFLPQVWAQLPDVTDFMAQLKRKAGLSADIWSADLKLKRYTVRKFNDSDREFPSCTGDIRGNCDA